MMLSSTFNKNDRNIVDKILKLFSVPCYASKSRDFFRDANIIQFHCSYFMGFAWKLELFHR